MGRSMSSSGGVVVVVIGGVDNKHALSGAGDAGVPITSQGQGGILIIIIISGWNGPARCCGGTGNTTREWTGS